MNVDKRIITYYKNNPQWCNDGRGQRIQYVVSHASVTADGTLDVTIWLYQPEEAFYMFHRDIEDTILAHITRKIQVYFNLRRQVRLTLQSKSMATDLMGYLRDRTMQWRSAAAGQSPSA